MTLKVLAFNRLQSMNMQSLLSDFVARLFSYFCPRKASGPDGISGRLLKSCSKELADAWCPIFQKSLDTHSVPSTWKSSTIIPVPKKASCKENNDYRPVALTSLVMKCFEKIMINFLKTEGSCFLDPFQFAYKYNRSTEDAILSVTHLIDKHRILAHLHVFYWLILVQHLIRCSHIF